MYTILYYTANRPPKPLAAKVRELIDRARHPDSQTVCVTHAKVGWGDVEVVRGDVPCGLFDQYVQILAGAKFANHETVFLCEDDVLYPAGHFDWRANGRRVLSYNGKLARMNELGAWPDTGRMIDSGCSGHLDTVKAAAQFKLDQINAGERIKWSELGSESPQAKCSEMHYGTNPFIDLRWGGNLTGRREARRGYHRDFPYWGDCAKLWKELGL